jgi:hypothetical protein
MEELTSTKCGYLDGNSDFILADELIGSRLPIYGQPMEVVSRSIDGQPIGGQSADKNAGADHSRRMGWKTAILFKPICKSRGDCENFTSLSDMEVSIIIIVGFRD